MRRMTELEMKQGLLRSNWAGICTVGRRCLVWQGGPFYTSTCGYDKPRIRGATPKGGDLTPI